MQKSSTLAELCFSSSSQKACQSEEPRGSEVRMRISHNKEMQKGNVFFFVYKAKLATLPMVPSHTSLFPWPRPLGCKLCFWAIKGSSGAFLQAVDDQSLSRVPPFPSRQDRRPPMPCSRDPKSPTSISLSPASTNSPVCGWDRYTLPQQTSPALQDLGPENIKTFKAK